MNGRNEMTRPFTAVLDALFNDEQVSVPLLYRLSDLTAEEFRQFTSRWAAVPDERRRVITRHLVDISEENYVVDFAPIFAYAFQDPSAPVRIAALDGVWDTTNIALVEPIIAIMQTDSSADVRAAAAAALAHYVLMAEWGELPRKISPRIVAALLAEYEKADSVPPVKRAALEALGAANHPQVSRCIREAYESDDMGMQVSALFAMGSSADEQWLPIILDEGSSDIPEMRLEAARAAGSIGHTDALPMLAKLAADTELEVGLAAVTALGQIGGDVAYRMLTMMAEDPDFEALHEAVDEALEEMDWLGGDFSLIDIPADGDEDELDDAYLINDSTDEFDED
jgi:HEAT repeat protein